MKDNYQDDFSIKRMKSSFFKAAIIAENTGRHELVKYFVDINIFITNLSSGSFQNSDIIPYDYVDIWNIFVDLDNIALVPDLEQRAALVIRFLEIHAEDLTRYVPDTTDVVPIMEVVINNNEAIYTIPEVYVDPLETLGAVSCCSIS